MLQAIQKAFSMARQLTPLTPFSPVVESILTVLDSHELHPFQILDAIEQGTDGKFQVGYGALYPRLRHLERKGLVQGRWGDERPEARGGARQKYYRISPLGADRLHELQRLRAGLAAWQPNEHQS
jgi:DNA-binding PadR family transcriptional regulator